MLLEPGMTFVLDASRTEPGDIKGVGLDYKELPRDVKAGDFNYATQAAQRFGWEKNLNFPTRGSP